VQHNAAHALLKAASDLRQAGEFAKRAVALAPRWIEPRLVLVEVYLAAGMPLAARRELEAAREIAPRDDRINELSKRLR
jgi:predicted TPR repeat methyltransferase